IFRELAISYLGRHDLAHVDTSDFSNTTLGKGIQEGKTNLISTGWTRGYKPTLVGAAGNEPKGSSGPGPRAAAASGATVTAISSVATARKLDTDADTSVVTAFRRDYEERAKELAEEAASEIQPAVETIFSDAAAKEASDAKALAAERRMQAMM